MEEIILKRNENRKDYLIRVAISMLRENGYSMETIVYDEAECDAFCLADDLEAEFDLD